MEYIKGKIITKDEHSFVFESSNTGYKIFGNCQNIKDCVYIHQITNTRTLESTMYGFSSPEEKQLFIELNKIKGFGPCSSFKLILQNSIEDINKVRQTGNVFALTTEGIKPSLVGLIVDAKNKNTEAELMLVKKTLEKYGFESFKINTAIKNVYKANLKIDKNILNLIKEINTLQ